MNRLIVLMSAACLLTGSAIGQSLDSSISIYRNNYPQEKIHIHFDKDTYLPGETVWMKAYLLSESNPSGISKNIYFDWTDADGRLLLHSIAPISDGGAGSSFLIPAWVKNGVVHVKAYTQWMLNFDNAFLYNKDIPVLMPVDNVNTPSEKGQTELSFFPEGGELVNGVTSILAFETSNPHHKLVMISGAIKNSKNAIIDSFRTSYKGMGTVRFKPIAGEHYNAYWSNENGDKQVTPVPQAKTNGLVLRVDSYMNDQFHYKIEKSKDASKLTKITVIGTINQKVAYRASLNLINNQAEATISALSYPGGVLQLTAFDANMQPLAERVIYVNNGKSYSKVEMWKEEISLKRRGRNEISIEVPDSLVTNLSVSVTDAGLGYDSSTNIYSDMLLAGELKGSIPDAASFLQNTGATANETNEHLNLLLLTHGWRKFNWETVVSGKFPDLKYARDAGFMSINGEIKFSTDLDVHDSVAMLLISRDRKKHVLKLPVDNHGKFVQSGLYFYDSVQIIYKVNNVSKLNSNGQIFVNSNLLPALTPAKADEPSFSWMRVPDVILEKELGGNLIETHDNSFASRSMSYIVSPKSDSIGKNSESAAHYLVDNFFDLRFPATLSETTSAGDAKLASYKPGKSTAPRNNVNVTIDGSPIAMDDLKSINMKEVLFIKFLSRSNGKGIPTLAITTRQALDQTNIMENKTGFAVITGYTPVREFYQPHYDTRIDDHAANDYRSTLYWNPKVRLDKTHKKMNVVFYNNDISSKFRIVIEGMNQAGKLCHIDEIIK